MCRNFGFVVFAVIVLACCGQKGDLYLPDDLSQANKEERKKNKDAANQ